MKKFSGLYDCTTVRTGRQTIVKPPMATNNIYVCFKNGKHKKLTHIFLYRNHMLVAFNQKVRVISWHSFFEMYVRPIGNLSN